jgi:HAD superfamily hydrolase (TIGR01509 family)
MVNYVIFDVDGTLVDSNDFHAQAWQKAFAEFGKTIEPADIRKEIGKGGDQLMPVFLSAEELEKFGKDLEERRGEIFKNEFLSRVQPFSDARTLIARMVADGKRIALGSSSPKDELEHYKELLGIEDFLEGETTGDDAEKSKPAPDIFEAALQELGNPPPNSVVVVGDSPYDAIAARKAGLKTIVLLCGGFDEEWLKKEGVIEIYQNPSDLLAKYEDSVLCCKDVAKPTTLSEIVSSILT